MEAGSATLAPMIIFVPLMNEKFSFVRFESYPRPDNAIVLTDIAPDWSNYTHGVSPNYSIDSVYNIRQKKPESNGYCRNCTCTPMPWERSYAEQRRDERCSGEFKMHGIRIGKICWTHAALWAYIVPFESEPSCRNVSCCKEEQGLICCTMGWQL